MTLRLGNKKVCPTKLVKVNNVDWSKIGYNTQSYYGIGASGNIRNGKMYLYDTGFYPRASIDEEYTTKFVNFSQPFEINLLHRLK